MQKREVTLYSIGELSEKVREKAIKRLREQGFGRVDPDFLTELFSEKLKDYGLPHDPKKIQWSLGYSQGDGVAFEGWVDVDAYLTAAEQLALPGAPKISMRKRWGERRPDRELLERADVEIKIAHHGRYTHARSMDVEYDFHGIEAETREEEKQIEAAVLALVDEIGKKVVDVSRELEKMGYSEIESLEGDEAIIELAETNELLFFKDGTLFREPREE
jgi:hypothetical protein